MNNIFVYGVLIFDDLWNRIVQRHYEKQTAVLPGYQRLTVKGECYPGLVKTFNGCVEGMIYFGVTAQDIKRLDKFEGKYYRKKPVRVLCKNGYAVNAKAYVLNRRYRRILSNSPWDPVQFQAHHLHKYIARYKVLSSR
jgi:gamma-glutamylcyclotransferase (GGCT)/AIG2-like uncharacterized protein YtfP